MVQNPQELDLSLVGFYCRLWGFIFEIMMNLKLVLIAIFRFAANVAVQDFV